MPETNERSSETEDATALVASLEDALRNLEYRYTRDDEDGRVFNLSFAGKKFSFPLYIYCGNGYVVFLCELPFIVPPKVEPTVLPTIVDLSSSIPVGSFELLRFGEDGKTVVVKYGFLVDEKLTSDVVKEAIALIIRLSDDHSDQIGAAIESAN